KVPLHPLSPLDAALIAYPVQEGDTLTHLLFEPVELLERLAALTPRPRINLVPPRGSVGTAQSLASPGSRYGRDLLAPLGPEARAARGAAAPSAPPTSEARFRVRRGPRPRGEKPPSSPARRNRSRLRRPIPGRQRNDEPRTPRSARL